MKRSQTLLFKVFALMTAVGLGGAYVWKRQQEAAPQIDRTEERAGSSRTGSDFISPIPGAVDQEQTDRALMSGSKSAVISEGVPLHVEGRTLMPGSKIGVIGLGPMDKTLVPNPEDPGPAERRTVLPGSKSYDSILTTKDIAPPNKDVPAKP